jgi:hypothetical protein
MDFVEGEDLASLIQRRVGAVEQACSGFLRWLMR